MSKLPPGPQSTIISTLRYASDPFGFHERAVRRFGRTYTLRAMQGPLVLTGEPAGAKQVFAADPAIFTPWHADALVPVLGARSLILVGGEHHTRDRRLLMPAFHGARMRTYASVMADAARHHAPELAHGGVFALTSLTERISLEVILRAVFGVDGARRMGQFRDAILDYVAAIHPAIIFLPSMRTRWFAPWRRFLTARARFEALMFSEIERRKRASGGDDVLSLLLAAHYDDGAPMSDREIHDEMITLLIAGHETTAAAVAWCIHDLLRTKSAMQRLIAELEGVSEQACPEELADLPYLSAVCSETLRLHPVVPDVSRELRADLELCGYRLQKGTAVGVSTVILHRDPVLYPEPLAYRPERFLGVKPSPFEFTPFGGGARRCLGAAFAQYEMKIVIGTLLRSYEFELASEAPVTHERRNLTVGPRGGVEVRMRARPHSRREHGGRSRDRGDAS